MKECQPLKKFQFIGLLIKEYQLILRKEYQFILRKKCHVILKKDCQFTL